MKAVLFCGIALAILGFLACQWAVLRVGKGRLYTAAADAPPRDVGLLLGTSEKLEDGRENRFFTYRIEAAADLYHSGKVRRLLLSGAARSGEEDEPARMKARLVEAGVPESALLLDGSGFRTLDSIVRAQSIFGLTRFTVISQRFHNQRALFLARGQGLDAIGFCARDVELPSSWKTRLREAFARVRAVADRWAGR